MNIIERQYLEYRRMEREIIALREENQYLREWLDKYEEADREDRANAGQVFRGTLELVKFLSQKSDTN
jgi:cell shape-determining protein MreC